MTRLTYYVITSHGTTIKTDSYDAAIAGLREVYGDDAVAYDSDGFECTNCEPAWGAGRVLVWCDEQSSVNDPGVRAVAEIRRFVEL